MKHAPRLPWIMLLLGCLLLCPSTGKAQQYYSASARVDSQCRFYTAQVEIPQGWRADDVAVSLDTNWMGCNGPVHPDRIAYELKGPGGQWSVTVPYHGDARGSMPKTLPPGVYTLRVTGSGRDTSVTMRYRLKSPVFEAERDNLNRFVTWRDSEVGRLDQWWQQTQQQLVNHRNGEKAALDQWWYEQQQRGVGVDTLTPMYNKRMAEIDGQYQQNVKNSELEYKKARNNLEAALIEAQKRFNNQMDKLGFSSSKVQVSRLPFPDVAVTVRPSGDDCAGCDCGAAGYMDVRCALCCM